MNHFYNLIDKARYSEVARFIKKYRKNKRSLYSALIYLRSNEITSAKLAFETVKFEKLNLKDQILYFIIKSDLAINVGNIDLASEILDSLFVNDLIYSKSFQRMHAVALYLKAILEMIKKQHQQSLLYINKSKMIFNDLGNEILVAKTFNIKGMIYRSQNEPDLAKVAFLSSIKLYNENNLKDSVATILFNLGGLHKDYCSYNQSLYFLNQCLIFATQKKLISMVYLERSKLFFKLSKIEQAKQEVVISIDLQNELQDYSFIGDSFNHLGHIYKKLEIYQESMDCYLTSIDINQQIKANDNWETKLHLVRLLIDQRNNSKAREIMDTIDQSGMNQNQILEIEGIKTQMEMQKSSHSSASDNWVVYRENGIFDLLIRSKLGEDSLIRDISEFALKDNINDRSMNCLVITDKWDSLLSRFFNFVLDDYGTRFDINQRLKSVIVKHKDIEPLDFAPIEIETRKLIAIKANYTNPFHPTEGNLILILYGSKQGMSNNILYFLENYLSSANQEKHNQIEILKFQLQKEVNLDQIINTDTLQVEIEPLFS